MARRLPPWGPLWILAPLLAHCAEPPAPPGPVVERSLGEELYTVLCEHLAGSEFPEDVTGQRAARPVCTLHQPAPVEGERGRRLEALRQQRGALVSALDAALSAPPVRDELFDFSLALLPLYDPPDEPLPNLTRAVSQALGRLAEDPQATAALERIGGRQGYRPLPDALGLLRALFRYPRLRPLLQELLGAVGEGGAAQGAFEALLHALGMELSAFEPAPRGEESTLEAARALLLRQDPAFLGDGPAAAFLAARDARGFAQPQPRAAGALVDKDGDQLFDVDRKGRFVDASGAPLPLATPFPTSADDDAPRAPDGRALDETGAPLYAYLDAEQTWLAGAAPDLAAWLTPDAQGRVPVLDAAYGLGALLGPATQARAAFGTGWLDYVTTDSRRAPLLQLVDFLALLLEAPELDDTLTLFDRLLRDHEPTVARLARAMLQAKARADLDTQAHLVEGAPFWDDMVWFLERLARRRGVEGQTALEGLLRALADPRAKHLGAVLSLAARYKDPIRINPRDINGPVVGRYETPVDREAPDLPGNRSQLERFLLLVAELMDRPLCNKATTAGALLRALGMGGAGIDWVADSFPVGECKFLKVPDMGRAFGLAMTGDLDLMDYISQQTLSAIVPAVVGERGLGRDLLDRVFAEQSGIADFDTTPTAAAFVRILFYPPGSKTEAFASALFYPFTVKPYTVEFDAALFDSSPGAGDGDRARPPAHLRLDELYRGALPFWEIEWDFGDGQPVSLMEAILPLFEALNAHDWVEGESDPATFDSKRYMFNALAALTAENYPSPANATQALQPPGRALQRDPARPHFSRMSNLVSYERLLGDLLASEAPRPSVYLDAHQAQRLAAQPALDLFGALWELMHTLDAMALGDGRDGIDVLAALCERLLNAHKHCDPSGPGSVNLRGEGVCHRPDAPRPPLRTRDGRDHLVWATGERYDGAAGLPFRPISPLQVLLEGLDQCDAAYDADDARRRAWRAARGALVDRLFESDGRQLLNPNTVPLLRHGLAWLRERLAVHSAQGGDQALRGWAADLPPRFERFVGSPIVAGLRRLLSDLQREPAATRELGHLLAHLLDGADARTFLLSMVDTLQLLRDRDNIPPLLRAAGPSLVPNARAVLGGAPLDTGPSEVQRALELLRALLEVDREDTLSKLLSALVSERPDHMDGGVAPLETLLTVTAEVHRRAPNAGGPLDVADLRAVLGQVQDFLSDDVRGMERMYQLLRHRTLAYKEER